MRFFSRFFPVLIHVFVAVVALHAAAGAVVTAGPEVKILKTTALLQWTTDVATGTRVNYGTNENLLTHRAEGAVSQQHVIELQGLLPGTQYFFSFGTARVPLGKGKFLTEGTPATPLTNARPAVSQVATATAAEKPTLFQRLFKKPATVPSTLPAAPPASQTWGHLDSLQDHFDRHGGDFKAQSPTDYASQAWQFLQRAKREGLPMKWDDADGSVRVFDPKTRSFASYDRRGKTRTYFKPSNPNYWAGQPGRSVTPAQLPF